LRLPPKGVKKRGKREHGGLYYRDLVTKEKMGELEKLKKDKCLIKPEGIFLSLHLNSSVSPPSKSGTEEWCNYINGWKVDYAPPTATFLGVNTLPISLLKGLTSNIGFNNRGYEIKGYYVLKNSIKNYAENDGILIQHALSETCFINVDTDMFRYLLLYDDIKDEYVSVIMSYYVKRIIKYFDECIKPIFFGDDKPDDNYSYSSAENKNDEIPYITSKSKIVMPLEFMDYNVIKLMSNMKEPLYFTFLKLNPKMAKENPLLIVPSGKLKEHQNNLSLKQTLKNYVQNGGTIIVFAQQYGRQIENIIPVPEGESLKVYGWREDQSCYWGSVYSSITNPVVSSLGNLGFRGWDLGFSMYEMKSKSSAKSHRFFIKRACSFLIEDKNFNKKFIKEELCLNI